MNQSRLNMETVKKGTGGTFGELLQTIRRHQGMTMKELSYQSNVSQSYISQLENDVRLPSDNVIKKLAHALAYVRIFDPTNYDASDDGTVPLLSEFDAENFEADITTGFKNAKIHTEAKEMEQQYLIKLKESNSSNETTKRELNLSKEDLDFIQRFKSLDDSKREALTKFMNYLIHESN